MLPKTLSKYYVYGKRKIIHKITLAGSSSLTAPQNVHFFYTLVCLKMFLIILIFNL